MTLLRQRALARLKYVAELAWLSMNCATWALCYFVQQIWIRLDEWQVARLVNKRDAAKRDYESRRAGLAKKRGSRRNLAS